MAQRLSLILRILLEQVFHGIALFFELVDAEIDLLLAEGIDGDALHDFPHAIFDGADRHGGHQAFFNAIRAIGANSDAMPVTGGSRVNSFPPCNNAVPRSSKLVVLLPPLLLRMPRSIP